MRLPDRDARAWVDGRFTSLAEVSIAIDDPVVQAGLGLFETIAVRSGHVLELREHLERLRAAAAKLEVPLPESTTLSEALRALAKEQTCSHGWLKLIATRGGRCVAYAGEADPAEEGMPASAVLLPWRRNLVGALDGMKSLNYAANVLGLEEAKRRGADEGLWLNGRGHLAEGCQSNLFVVQRRKLFTPGPRDGILCGIVRGMVLRAAREAGITVHEGKVRLPRLRQSGEAFLTSSVRGVRPLLTFEGRAVGSGLPGPVTRELAEAVSRMRLTAVRGSEFDSEET